MDGSAKYKLNWNDFRHVALHTAMVAVAAFFVLLPADGGDSLVALLGTLKMAGLFALQSSARQWMRDNGVDEPRGDAGAIVSDPRLQQLDKGGQVASHDEQQQQPGPVSPYRQ